MPPFKSRANTAAESFATNREQMLELIAELRELEASARNRSDASRERFEARGQLLPRERIEHLLDPGAPWLELQSVAGWQADGERTAGGSLIAGVGYVSGTRCMVVAHDSGIGAGAMDWAAGEKLIRVQAIALENKLPFVFLVESAGANLLEYRVETWTQAGRWFANLAKLSGAGIPTVTVLHGSGTAGGAYFPGMSDVVIGVRGGGKAFLAGPPLLKAATGEIADAEELGGVDMHATVSGLIEHRAESDRDALRIARDVVARMHWGADWLWPAPADFEEPLYDPDEIAGIVPVDYRRGYDVREVIARIADGSDLLEFKADWGPETICLEASIHGYPAGLIANNGAIDNAGAAKVTHFIQRCTQLGTPLVFLQNITGYMVGIEAERGGMIKNGAKMIQAVMNTPVPRITMMLGASFGAGNYGMSGRGYDPRLLFAWPNSRSGVMGGAQAAQTMRIVAEDKAERKGESADAAEMDALVERITALYEAQEPAFVTSGRGLDDGVIDPRDSRKVLAISLATVHEAEIAKPRPLSFGVGRI